MKKSRYLLSTLLLGALALLGSQAPANAAQFCVTSAASLQTALATAAGNGVDDEVRIVQGTYVGNFVYASTQANNLSVQGGYTAGCAGRVLDPANTILDGNQTNSVLVLSAPDVAAEFLVEGLSLLKGKRASGNGGGGLYALVGNDGTVTVNRNRIENNSASGSNYGGGGAYISSPTATLANNSITGNTAKDFSGYFGGGGGMYISAISVTLTKNSIMGNTATDGVGIGSANGGGAYISATTTTLANNSITGNTAIGDGGGALISAKTTIITNNTLVGNEGLDGVGLILVTGNTEATDSATLYNNLFWDNLASGAGESRTSASTTTKTATTSQPRSPCSPTTSTGRWPALRPRSPSPLTPVI